MLQTASTHSARYAYLMLARGHLLGASVAMLALLLSTLAANADADWPRLPTDAEIAQMANDLGSQCAREAGAPANAVVKTLGLKRHNEKDFRDEWLLRNLGGPPAVSALYIGAEVYWQDESAVLPRDRFKSFRCGNGEVKFESGRFVTTLGARDPLVTASSDPPPGDLERWCMICGRFPDLGFAPMAPEEATKAHKPLCLEALVRFGLRPSAIHNSNMTMDYNDIKQQFEEAKKKYDARHVSQKSHLGATEIGMAPLLSWMANQGGTVDFISKRFVFATDDDRKEWAEQSSVPPAEKDNVRRGTERQLRNEMYRLYRDLNVNNTPPKKRKLSPGDIFYLALEQRDGNMKEAMLLAHNTLRSMARMNDGPLTEVHPDDYAFETILEPLIEPEPLGKGQNAGALYHLFTTATIEMNARSDVTLLAANGIDFVGDTAREQLQTLLGAMKTDPKLELQTTQTVLSAFVNEVEQYGRTLFWRSPVDPDKYCYNIIGARLGAWLSQASYEPAKINDIPSRQVPIIVEFGMSPMDITWEGNGFKMTFRQESQDFSGFYPLQLFPFYEEDSGTWGMAWADLLGKPYKITLAGDKDGPGHIVSLSVSEAPKGGDYRAFYLPLKAGQKYGYDVSPNAGPEYLEDEQTGARIEPAVVAKLSSSTASTEGTVNPQPDAAQPTWPSPAIETPPVSTEAPEPAPAWPSTPQTQTTAENQPSEACYTPGGAERHAVLETMRGPVAHDLAQSVLFMVSTIRICGQWAFVIAEPIKPGGGTIQWQSTVCKGDVSHLIGALEQKHAAGGWTLKEYALCPTDVAWENWPEKYGAPQALFAQ